MITVIDIQGKLIRKFGNNEVAFFKNGITARWDKRDMRSYLVPKGVYIIRMFSAFKTYCSTVIVR